MSEQRDQSGWWVVVLGHAWGALFRRAGVVCEPDRIKAMKRGPGRTTQDNRALTRRLAVVRHTYD